ncbi:transferrin receptor [Aspergillus oryzae 100-8]|nr:transferrin receptor [Aspergillus oryzae 100-8]
MPALGASQEFFQIAEDETTRHSQSVKKLITQLDPLSLHTMIEDFLDFQNRFFNGSEYSMKASRWLYTKINQTVTASNATGVAVEVFDHAGWDQPSIIVSIPGMSTKTIVVGAHQDSIIRPYDNASGVATLIEALRAILRDPDFAQGHVPNTLKFHFYAAEEVGLQGSKQIFDSYSSQGREVKAMLERIGVLTDYVDLGLTEFVRMIIKTVKRAETIKIKHVLQNVKLVIGLEYELGFAPLGNEDITEEL